MVRISKNAVCACFWAVVPIIGVPITAAAQEFSGATAHWFLGTPSVYQKNESATWDVQGGPPNGEIFFEDQAFRGGLGVELERLGQPNCTGEALVSWEFTPSVGGLRQDEGFEARVTASGTSDAECLEPFRVSGHLHPVQGTVECGEVFEGFTSAEAALFRFSDRQAKRDAVAIEVFRRDVAAQEVNALTLDDQQTFDRSHYNAERGMFLVFVGFADEIYVVCYPYKAS